MASPNINVENIERKMRGVSNTQDSIQSLSLWAIHHKSDAKQIVDIWLKILKKAQTKQRLALFNLCNDIVQNGKRKKATIYMEVFKGVLREAIILVRDDTISKNISRILKIWKERHVFPKDFIAEITDLYESKDTSTHSTPTSVANNSSSSTPTTTATSQLTPKAAIVQYPVNIDPELIENFKPQTLIDKINNYKRYEAEVELKRKQLSNMKLDASSTEAIKQLKDKAHGNQFSKQFEESCSKLEDYVSSANKDIIEKMALIEMLETSQLFYEEQYKEAKIVANAYKNFGTRINNLRKRLEDLVKSLPSPVPSPSRDAPSPGNTPPEETLDNIESVDMDIDDESSSIVPKSAVETSAVVMDGAEDSYEPGSDPFLPSQTQFSQPFNDGNALQNISTLMSGQQNMTSVNQGNSYNGQDPRKPVSGEIPVYNPPPKTNALKVLSKSEEGGSTPVKDEGSSTPVMDEKQDSPPPSKHQNPIDFLTQILANTAKTTASGSNFLASLSLLTNTVKTQFQQKKEDTTMTNSQPIMSEQAAGSWAEWKSQNQPTPVAPPTPVGPPPGPVPPVIPPPMFQQMPPLSQPPPIGTQPSMSATHITASSSQNHLPTSPPILSTSVNQHPYAPVSAPPFRPMNPPPRPAEPWRPPTLPPVQRPPTFPGYGGIGVGDHLSSPPWRQPPPISQTPPSQQHEEQLPWDDYQGQDSNLPSPTAPIAPPVQPKGILRNRSSSLREVPLINDNMAINPEPPAEPPSPVEGRNKFMRQFSDSAGGGQVQDDHREFLEKLKRKTTGGPNLVSPPVVEDSHNNKARMFATNRSRPNLTTITPVDFGDQQMNNNMIPENETENGALEEINNDSLNALSAYTEQEGEGVPEEGMEGVGEEQEEYQEEVQDYEHTVEEEEQYDERPFNHRLTPRDYRPPFHRHPRPPPPHDPYFRPRFPPRFEPPFRREPYPDPYREPYGPPKRPYNDYPPHFRRPPPFHRY